ncbi:MAG TPA: hypothetical protein VH044_19515 [Polyangiaceae bacterium]|jgi:hypothetical protein|nr:hypothetical protein [Polyangiaceae bacterium]
MTKPTNKDLLDAIDDVTGEAEMERLLEMSDEQHREELAKSGVDVEALDAKAKAFFATLDQRLAARGAAAAREQAPAPELTPAPEPAQAQPLAAPREPTPIRLFWRRPLIAIPSAVALAAGVLLVVHAFRAPPIIGPDVLLPAEEQALNLRNEALGACQASDWKKCLDDLDQARAIDPSGDATSHMKQLREIAEQGLRDTPPEPSTPPPRPPGPDDNLKVPKSPH